MSVPWHPAWPPGQMVPDATTVLEGTSFCISDVAGDVGPDTTDRRHGLYVRDVRVLSRWRLRVGAADGAGPDGGSPLHPLTTHHSSPHGVLLVGHLHVDGTRFLVERKRYVGDGLLETVRVRNTSGRQARLEVMLEVDADFSSAAAIRAGVGHAAASPGGVERVRATPLPASSGHGAALRLTGAPDSSVVVRCSSSTDVPRIDGNTLRWSLDLPGHAAWSTELQVLPRLHGTDRTPHHVPGAPPVEAAPVQHRSRRRRPPRISTASPQLAAALTRGLEDLTALRVFDPEHPRLPLVAAGAPWTMVPLARESLLTATMLLPADPHLALGTLSFLAGQQGRAGRPGRIPARPVLDDPASDVRSAPSSVEPYVASDDADDEATALFVLAAGSLHRWHPHLVSGELHHAAASALRHLADTADASEAEGPAERHAYLYGAFRAGAELAAADGQPGLAQQWEVQAEQTRRGFDKHYWLPDLGHYAAAVTDGQVDERLAATLGHCLWTGIVDQTRAARLARALLSRELASGWGLRSSATSAPDHDPFHLQHGAVWPQDTALAVAGLTRYGFCDEAGALATTLVDLATACGARVPGTVVGVDRSDVPVPLPHPAGCAPAAAAAAAPVEVIRALLRAEPSEQGLVCDPCVPEEYLPLELQGVRCRGATYDVSVTVDGSQVRRRD